MTRTTRLLAASLLVGLAATLARADEPKVEMNQKGDMHIIGLSGRYNFYAVLDMLQVQLFDRGWLVRNVHDVDLRLRKLGELVHAKVITASKPEYVLEAVQANLRGALVIPTDIVIYETYKDVEHPWSYRTSPGTIEIAFIDPAAKARAVDLEGLPNLEATTAELREAVESTAAFFIEASTVPQEAAPSEP
jgi:uncharacterized protein (DUF302 family)